MKLIQKTYNLNDQKDKEKVCAIIFLDTSKKVIVYSENKGGGVKTKDTQAPEWFKDFATKVETFMVEQKKFNETLLSLPTIKKEMATK